MRVLIVDDEPLARSAMRRLLAAHPDVEILGEADSTETARAHIASLQPDLIFLDIELGGGRDKVGAATCAVGAATRAGSDRAQDATSDLVRLAGGDRGDLRRR